MSRSVLRRTPLVVCSVLLVSLTLPSLAVQKVGTNFWFSWRGSAATDPFLSNANFGAYPNHSNVWKQVVFDDCAAYNGPLRFMDWLCINSSDQVTWSTRKQPTDPNQEGPWLDPARTDNVGKGIAIEWLIELGNLTNRDIWLCVPHKADDTYVREMTRLVKAKLNTGLKCYIEYSNEVWNPGFEQNLYARQQGAAMGFPGDQWEQAHHWYGYRSGQIFNIWTTEFSGQLNRIVRVLSAQNLDHTWQANVIYDRMKTSTNATADAWSVAPYFARGSSTISQMYGSIDTEVTRVSVQSNFADSKGLLFVAYEGGQHVHETNADTVNRDPAIYDVYQYYLNKMNPYFDIFAHYAHTSTYSSTGAWGAKEGWDQPLSSAHKFRSIKDWVAANGGNPNQVAAPSFSPAPGTFTSAQSVTISSSTSGATIRYTTNGTNPTSTTGTVYSGPVSIGSTTTLKAIAYKSGMTDSSVSSGTYTINLPQTANIAAGSATVDAAVEAAWGNATAYTLGKTGGTVSSSSDCSGTWKGLWDSTNLYLLAEVTDDNKSNDSTNPWDDDSVELYVDGGNNKSTSYDANDRQYIFGWGDAAVVEGGGRSSTGVTFAKADPTTSSYRIEAKVPWGTLGVTKSAGQSIGIDVHVNDDDAGGAREGKKMWNDTTDQAWANPSTFGTATLQSGGTSAPSAPTGLTATAGNAQVALSWSASSGATSYNVKRSTTSGSGYTTINSPMTTSYTNTGLTNGTTYYYVVSAVNSVGESANSSQVSATPMGGQVAAPSFTPAAGTYSSSQSVTISTSTSGASIRFTTDGSTPTSTTGTLYSGAVTISATTTLKAIAYKSGMTDSTVTSGTYTISTGSTNPSIPNGTITVDAAVDSTWGNAAAVSIAHTVGTISSTSDCSGTWKALWDSTNLYVLAEVTDDNKSNDSTDPWADDSVEVYLDGNNNKATSYDSNDRQYIFGWGDTTVREGGNRSSTGVSFAKADPTSTSYRIELKVPWGTLGVTASGGKNVGFDVHINDDDSGGAREGKKQWHDTTDQAWANPSLFGTVTLAAATGSAPATPTGLTATAGNAQVALSWNASTGATSYNVKRSTTSGSGYSTIASPTTTSYTNSSLTNGTTYYYVVSAVNSVGESANSGQVSATPAAPAGGTFTLNPTADMSSQNDASGSNTSPPISQWANFYMKFSTSTVTGSVSNAKLRLYRNATGAGSITIYCYQGASDSWSEGGTLPGLGSQITSVANNKKGYVEFDVTSFVNSQVSGDDVVTLAITTSTGTWEYVNSSEASTNKPQLVITTQ